MLFRSIHVPQLVRCVANLRQLRVVLRDLASRVSLDNALLLLLTSKESYVLSCQRRRHLLRRI